MICSTLFFFLLLSLTLQGCDDDLEVLFDLKVISNGPFDQLEFVVLALALPGCLARGQTVQQNPPYDIQLFFVVDTALQLILSPPNFVMALGVFLCDAGAAGHCCCKPKCFPQ